MILRFVGLMYSVVICTTKFKSLTTGYLLSFHNTVAIQHISHTGSYSTKMRICDYHCKPCNKQGCNKLVISICVAI